MCRQCGNLVSECSDASIDWHPHRRVCFATAATQWKWRMLAEEFPADKKGADGAHPLDGINVWAAQFPPSDEVEAKFA